MQPRSQNQAPPPRRKSQKKSSVFTAIALLLLLLLPLPALAVYCLPPWIDARISGAYFAIISLVTLLLYRTDKRRAEAGAWRIPESTLHLSELAGGWPGAFVAQRLFRHKTSKRSYQFAFWCIVLLHQLLAFDYLQGWPLAKAALGALR